MHQRVAQLGQLPQFTLDVADHRLAACGGLELFPKGAVLVHIADLSQAPLDAIERQEKAGGVGRGRS